MQRLQCAQDMVNEIIFTRQAFSAHDTITSINYLANYLFKHHPADIRCASGELNRTSWESPPARKVLNKLLETDTKLSIISRYKPVELLQKENPTLYELWMQDKNVTLRYLKKIGEGNAEKFQRPKYHFVIIDSKHLYFEGHHEPGQERESYFGERVGNLVDTRYNPVWSKLLNRSVELERHI